MTLATAFAGLATRVSAAVGAPYYAGNVIIPGTDGGYDDDGNYVPGSPPTLAPCKVQVDAMSEAWRAQAGFADGEYRFIVLASGFNGTLNTDASISVADGPFAGTWSVSSLTMDPAAIGWVGKGRRA